MTSILMTDTRTIIDALRTAKKVLLTSHIRPDFDTLCSMLAMKLALEKVGKDVTAYNETGPSPDMMDMPGAKDVVTRLHPTKKFDITLALDAGDPRRYGESVFSEKSRQRLGTLIVVDHHLDPKPFGDLYFVDSTSASTGELVADLISQYPVEFDYDIALNIYTAIVSDTGGFRYSNTDARSFKWASKMIAYGVNAWDVTLRLYENKPLSEIKLLSEVLPTLELFHKDQLAILHVTRDMLQRTGAYEYMLDGFVNFGRSIMGVEVAILMKEASTEDAFRMSLRSKGTVNVAAISQSFDGGGHHNAAGCTIKGDLKTIKAKLVKAAKPCLK